jgi:hypothetical protein
MIDLGSPLGAKLQRHRISVRAADPDTVLLRNVPANAHFYSKARTNLLVRRLRPGLPFVIAVDADLEYRGPDAGLARAFESGSLKEGWRVISVGAASGGGFEQAVEEGLLAVGFEDQEPRLAPGGEAARGNRVVERFGVELPEPHEAMVGTVGRAEELASLMATLTQQRPRMPILVGLPGVGKSSLLAALAAALKAREPCWRVVRIDLGELFAGVLLESDRENLLSAALEAAAPGRGTVLALERIDLAGAETAHGPALLARRVEGGVRVVGTALPDAVASLECDPLLRHLQVIRLDPLDRTATLAVLGNVRATLAAHHGIPIAECSLEAAVDRALALAGALPATAVALLDAACATARLDGGASVDPVHINLAACGFPDIDDIPCRPFGRRPSRERP